MHHQPLEITYEIELNPGERLTPPDALVNSVGPGRWLVTVQSLPPTSAVRDHSGPKTDLWLVQTVGALIIFIGWLVALAR